MNIGTAAQLERQSDRGSIIFDAYARHATFWLYGAVRIGAWLFALFLVPETKGKTLEQIEAYIQAESIHGHCESRA
jgi:hypothetical protein